MTTRDQIWRDRIWPYLITALAAGAAALVILDVTTVIRPAVVLAFLLVCPGMALIRLLRVGEPLPELLLAIVVSLALAAVLATISIYAGVWNPPLVFGLIAVITLAAVVADAIRTARAGT